MNNKRRNKHGIKMDTDRPPRKKQAKQAEREEMIYQSGTNQKNKRKKNSEKGAINNGRSKD